jgi:hypothetical protein
MNRNDVLAALIGFVGGVLGGVLGYYGADKAADLQRKQLMVSTIFLMNERNIDLNKPFLGRLKRAKILDPADLEILCGLFVNGPCSTLPDK